MADIDFFTFITKNSLPFAKFLRQTGEMTKSKKHNIHWKCVISSRIKNAPNGFECIFKSGSNISTNGSMRHAIAIEEALKRATSEYIIIADADVALLYKDWDKVVVQTLCEGYSCFGSPSPSNKYGEQDFPNVPFIAFKKSIMKKIKLNFKPILDKKNKITSVKIKNEKERYMGRGIGKEVFFETGCQVSLPFRKAGLKSKCLESVPVTSKKIILKHKNFKMKIYHKWLIRDYFRFSHNKFFEYHYNKKLFAVHLGSGGYIGTDCKYAKLWKDRVKHYLSQLPEDI